jgi:hypothetical protein
MKGSTLFGDARACGCRPLFGRHSFPAPACRTYLRPVPADRQPCAARDAHHIVRAVLGAHAAAGRATRDAQQRSGREAKIVTLLLVVVLLLLGRAREATDRRRRRRGGGAAAPGRGAHKRAPACTDASAGAPARTSLQ